MRAEARPDRKKTTFMSRERLSITRRERRSSTIYASAVTPREPALKYWNIRLSSKKLASGVQKTGFRMPWDFVSGFYQPPYPHASYPHARHPHASYQGIALATPQVRSNQKPLQGLPWTFYLSAVNRFDSRDLYREAVFSCKTPFWIALSSADTVSR